MVSDSIKEKTDSDFRFLKTLIDFAKVNKWRVVVSGGYGMDFFFNKITRRHGDVDAIVYGREIRSSAIKKFNRFIIENFSSSTMITKQEEFYVEFDVKDHGFGANIYFVETVEDPFMDLNKVRKLNGEVVVNTEDNFPKPVPGKIDNFEVEVQDQNAHLADILARRGYDKSLSKHDQDIPNLRKVTDPKRVESLLKNR